MANRTTLLDVAREAGVSIATVNRVIAGAGSVREETARKVAEAAARLGYHGRNLIEQHVKASLPEVRLGILLHKEKQSFYQIFAKELERKARQVTDARLTLDIHYSASQAPGDVAAQIRDIAQSVDVVAATAINHHSVTEAVSDIAERGVPCFSLLSDFAQGVRKSYFGLNNLKVGRGAARMLSATTRRAGKVALFVGGNRWHGHELRETGFRGHFREVAPGFHPLDTLINLETRQLTYEATLELLSRHPDLVGIYLAGGGMEGAIQAFREETSPGQVAMVVNEVTPESRAALEDGYVCLIIATPLRELCNALIVAMTNAKVAPETVQSGQVFLDPILYLPEFF